MLSHYPISNCWWFRLCPFRSPLLRVSLLLSFPPATKMFQFAGFARTDLLIQSAVFGLPHSEISGSLLVSSSPKLIVGHHVLLRLCVPRYPPLAFCSLTTIVFFSALTITLVIARGSTFWLFYTSLCNFLGSLLDSKSSILNWFFDAVPVLSLFLVPFFCWLSISFWLLAASPFL